MSLQLLLTLTTRRNYEQLDGIGHIPLTEVEIEIVSSSNQTRFKTIALNSHLPVRCRNVPIWHHICYTIISTNKAFLINGYMILMEALHQHSALWLSSRQLITSGNKLIKYCPLFHLLLVVFTWNIDLW